VTDKNQTLARRPR